MKSKQPPPRRKLSRSELKLFAKIYLSAQAAAAEPAWFGGLREDEVAHLEQELLKLSAQLHSGAHLSSTDEILNFILSLRK